MAGSLIIGPYDVLSASSPVTLDFGSDFGSGAPDTTTVARLLLDGDVVSGVRTANRQLQLTLNIDPSLPPGQVGQVIASLYATVDQPLWQMPWTPDAASATVVFDCQRGELVRGWNGGLFASVTLTIPALPFTRDALPTVLAPPTSGAGTGTLDALATTTGLTGAPAYTFVYPEDDPNSAHFYTAGPNPGAATLTVDSATTPPGQSASVRQTTDALWEEYQYTSYFTLPGGSLTAETYTSYASQLYFRWHRAVTSIDMTDTGQVGVYAACNLTNAFAAGVASVRNTGQWGGGSDRTDASSGDWRLTLYSASGSSTWLTAQSVGSAADTVDMTWQRVLFNLTAAAESTTGTFDITSVTSYRLEHWEVTQNGGDPGRSVWLSQLDAIGAAGGVNLTGPFGLVRFDGIGGAARTPVSMVVSATGGTLLSKLLVARTPNPPAGFSPILSVPATGTGATTAGTGESATATLTGHWWPSGTTYTRNALSFAGTYEVLARISPQNGVNTTPLVLSLSAANGGDTQTATATLTKDDPRDSQRWVSLGVLTLPAKRVDPANTAAMITFTWTATTTTTLTCLDMIVLVDLAGDVVDINLPSGHTCSEFFLDAPGPTDQRGKLSGGTVADRSDAIDLTEWATGILTNFDPGSNTITMVADNAPTGVTARVSYYSRWPGERPTQ